MVKLLAIKTSPGRYSRPVQVVRGIHASRSCVLEVAGPGPERPQSDIGLTDRA